jgi:hypothetical protein
MDQNWITRPAPPEPADLAAWAGVWKSARLSPGCCGGAGWTAPTAMTNT